MEIRSSVKIQHEVVDLNLDTTEKKSEEKGSGGVAAASDSVETSKSKNGFDFTNGQYELSATQQEAANEEIEKLSEQLGLNGGNTATNTDRGRLTNLANSFLNKAPDDGSQQTQQNPADKINSQKGQFTDITGFNNALNPDDHGKGSDAFADIGKNPRDVLAGMRKQPGSDPMTSAMQGLLTDATKHSDKYSAKIDSGGGLTGQDLIDIAMDLIDGQGGKDDQTIWDVANNLLEQGKQMLQEAKEEAAPLVQEAADDAEPVIAEAELLTDQEIAADAPLVDAAVTAAIDTLLIVKDQAPPDSGIDPLPSQSQIDFALARDKMLHIGPAFRNPGNVDPGGEGADTGGLVGGSADPGMLAGHNEEKLVGDPGQVPDTDRPIGTPTGTPGQSGPTDPDQWDTNNGPQGAHAKDSGPGTEHIGPSSGPLVTSHTTTTNKNQDDDSSSSSSSLRFINLGKKRG